MSSQTDLDQGGTFRQTQKLYLGPSVGWVEVQYQWILNVTAAGTVTLARGTNVILVNFNGAGVILSLPSFKASAAGAQAIPKQFTTVPLIISDIGGFAFTNPITVNAFAGEPISGLTTFQLNSNFGSLVIRPDIVNGGGTFMQ